MEEGHFLFCANDLYAQHMAACIVSLLENSSLQHHNIVVAGKFDDPKVAGQLEELIGRFSNVSLTIIKFSPPDDLRLPTRIHYTKDIFSRLWVEEFFPSEVEKVLYLDSDMIITRDIAELWRLDLNGKLFAAADIPGSDRNSYLGVPESHGYFNSGVLLIDLKLWRQEKALPEVVDYIEKNADRLIDPDQDALNACFYNRRFVLDVTWNVISPFTLGDMAPAYSTSECKHIVHNAHIVHFNGQTKPWHYLNSHPYKKDYWRYVRMTPWYRAQEEGRTFVAGIKKLYNWIVPLKLRLWFWRIRGRGES